MAEALAATPSLSRWLKRLYELSGIEGRYSCLPEAQTLDFASRFRPGRAAAETPSTSERMQIYQREAVALAEVAARKALGRLDENAAASITHLIAVSCTGFFAPGLDFVLAQALGLRSDVERTLVGFMGCAAAFNALRLAHHIVRGQPEARVLVVCVELCTLHIQPTDDRISLVVASLFADGAGACVVGAADDPQRDALRIGGFHTEIVPDSTHDMAWRIADQGFVMGLSPDVPRRIGEIAPDALAQLFAPDERPAFWAIHPGGRAIVDRLVELFALTPRETRSSYAVLRQFGNMSSPTILFVLEHLWADLRVEAIGRDGVAMAFGPGLVTEMARLQYVPARAQRPLASALPEGEQGEHVTSDHLLAAGVV